MTPNGLRFCETQVKRLGDNAVPAFLKRFGALPVCNRMNILGSKRKRERTRRESRGSTQGKQREHASKQEEEQGRRGKETTNLLNKCPSYRDGGALVPGD